MVGETKDSIFKSMQNEVSQRNPDIDPYATGGVFNTLLAAFAGQFASLYDNNNYIIDEAFRRLGETSQLTQTPASVSTGKVVFISTPLLPSNPTPPVLNIGDSIYTNGLWYHVIKAGVVSTRVMPVQKVAQYLGVPGVALATLDQEHDLITGATVLMSGTGDNHYDGLHEVIGIVDEFSFTYTIDPSAPPNPPNHAVMQIRVADTGVAEVEGAGEGFIYNADPGAIMHPPTAGTKFKSIRVGAGGITGGAFAETDAAFNLKVERFFKYPIAPFTEENIRAVATEAGAGGLGFIIDYAPTGTDPIVKIYIMGKSTIVPNQQELDIISHAIEKIVPVNLSFGRQATDKQIVTLPIKEVPVKVDVSGITPNNSTMYTAINNSVVDYFSNLIKPCGVLTIEDLSYAIRETSDAAGNPLVSFTISTPTSSLPVSDGGIYVLDGGAVNFV